MYIHLRHATRADRLDGLIEKYCLFPNTDLVDVYNQVGWLCSSTPSRRVVSVFARSKTDSFLSREYSGNANF
jgi:hypothetical protein